MKTQLLALYNRTTDYRIVHAERHVCIFRSSRIKINAAGQKKTFPQSIVY